ncbi:hypothetical protein RchiOBHm_Chr4g0398321 [Rosa chinensis]|uniref:Uncharacterized protein n=1 Tax=Rosa chinensis TaxID=74649 RepID=A0A2P6QSA9_ROSCH|nr:hypothetical protein RchiOBHm_Chr4g0398321 [Rosa chinensis]
MLDRNLSFKETLGTEDCRGKHLLKLKPMLTFALSQPDFMFLPRLVKELDDAAVKVQKVLYIKLKETLQIVQWWLRRYDGNLLDSAALKQSSVSFFDIGKCLSKDEKTQNLALQHWLEAIDPRHRYRHNLHMYYELWFESQSSQLSSTERKAYEVVVKDGNLSSY